MSTPRDINRAHISFDAASKVLDSIESGDAGGAGGLGGGSGGGGSGDDGGGESPRRPIIDGYVLDRELGSGASGITYLAYKPGAEARVALKVLHASLSNKTKASRAWRELEMLQQIRVPCVPRLLDYGTTGGSLYIATEFLEGSPLDRLYAHAKPANPAEMRERMQLLERIARAAHTLHEHGVIHRDLKPSNVIVMPNGPDGQGGTPFIIDLGIALIDTPDLHHTLTIEGPPIGTPAFMAPEQARGESAAISTRSDIYSLGAIGYWLCTGETPHDLAGVTLHEAIRRVGSEVPRGARGISGKLPKPLAAILDTACAAKSADRYASAADFADDIRRYLSREPVRATNPGPWRRLIRSVERHPVTTTAAVCLILLLTTLAARQATIWAFYQRPFRVVISTPDRQWARLESRSGDVLYEWQTDTGVVRYAQLVDAGVGSSPRMRVITVLEEPLPPYNGPAQQLCVWDANNPDRLLWSTTGEPPEFQAPRHSLPEGTSGDFLATKEHYFASEVVVADVFDGTPGNELIVTFSHTFDPSTIRVYTIDGELLYQAWHWGSIESPVWLEEEGLLIATGCNNEYPLQELGYPGTAYRWPNVAFAIRPRFGASDDWINPRMALPGQEAVWYTWVYPLDARNEYSIGTSPRSTSGIDGPARFNIRISAKAHPDAAQILFCDSDGRILSTQVNDAWRSLSDDLDQTAFWLGEEPEPTDEDE